MPMQARVNFLIATIVISLVGAHFVLGGDSNPAPVVRPKGYFNCYVPKCDPVQVFMDLPGRSMIDVEIMLTARERDSGIEMRKVRTFLIDPDKTWRLTPQPANELDRLRWYIREPGQEWNATPTMECRCSYFGSSIEVFVHGEKVDEYPNPNMP